MQDPLIKELVARFSGEREFRCDAIALLWHGVLLGAFGLLCVGALSPTMFIVIGLCAYVRNFNAIHQASHARRSRRNPLRRLRRLVMVVHSPLQLGFAELARVHRQHHAFTGDAERDPHVAVNDASWSTAAGHACVAPEMSLVGYVQREGKISGGLAVGLLYNVVMCAALVWFAEAQIVWWIAVTRLGSTAAWFIFDWILHHPSVWRSPAYTPGRLFAAVWSLMFGRENLNATRFHVLHHRYAFVADRELPALARLLDGRVA